jgi:hypothetical protein
MIGLNLFYAIDQRLRQAFPHRTDAPFGGLTVIYLVTLPTTPRHRSIIRASCLYRTCFPRVFEQVEQMRQQGNTPMDVAFQTALSNLRLGNIQKENWQFFQTRVLSRMPQDERVRFEKNAMLHFSGNVEVDEHNIKMLEALGCPVAKIEAMYHGISVDEGARIDAENCQNLEHVLYLSVGCRVILSALHQFTNQRSC